MKMLVTTALALTLLGGSALAESRNLQGFTGVGAEGRFNVDVSVGDHYSVDVTGPDAAKIATTLEGSSLHIKGTEWSMFGDPRYDAVVHVVTPRLEAIQASRGVTLTATGVRADNLALASSMGADLHVSGACQNLNAHVSMGADLYGGDLDCAGGDVSASMGADARVHLHDSVNASASMGADVHVSGNPAHRAGHSSMGADIRYE